VSAWPGILAGAPAVAFAEAYEVGPFASLFLVAGPLPDYQSTPDQGSSIHSRHTNSSLRRSLYGHAAFGPRRFGFGLHWPNHLNEEDLYPSRFSCPESLLYQPPISALFIEATAQEFNPVAPSVRTDLREEIEVD